MKQINLQNSPPVRNALLAEFACEIDKHLIVDEEIQCPVDPGKVHVLVKRQLFNLCISKGEWFGLPVNSNTRIYNSTPKHGLRQIRGNCKFSKLEILDSNKKEFTNLVSNLQNLEKIPWQKISKSVRDLKKRKVEILDFNFSHSEIQKYFVLMMTWIKLRHSSSPLERLDLNSLILCSKVFSEQMYLTVLFIDEVPASIIWTARSKLEYSAFFISTSFNETFSKVSPGTFLFYSLADTLKKSEYLWFDLGSGHHEYKKSLSSHYYEKYFISNSCDKSLIESLYNRSIFGEYRLKVEE